MSSHFLELRLNKLFKINVKNYIFIIKAFRFYPENSTYISTRYGNLISEHQFSFSLHFVSVVQTHTPTLYVFTYIMMMELNLKLVCIEYKKSIYKCEIESRGCEINKWMIHEYLNELSGIVNLCAQRYVCDLSHIRKRRHTR